MKSHSEKMKRIAVMVLMIAAVMITVPILLKDLFWSQPTVIQTRVSPDGMYTAYVFESNAGATNRLDLPHISARFRPMIFHGLITARCLSVIMPVKVQHGKKKMSEIFVSSIGH